MKVSQLIPHVPALRGSAHSKEQLQDKNGKKKKDESFEKILQAALK